MLTVRDIMSPFPVVARETTPLEDLARLILEYHIGCVPIVDAQEKLIGIVSESDFVGNERNIPFSSVLLPSLAEEEITPEGLAWLRERGRLWQAWEIMRAPVETATEEETVAHIIRRLVEDSLKRLPVVREGKVVGVVTRHDLLRVLVPQAACAPWGGEPLAAHRAPTGAEASSYSS